MKTVINIKADKDVKEQAAETARSMGIPLSTIINAFLKRFIVDQSVTFVAPLTPSRQLKKTLKQADHDIRKGRNLSPLFVSPQKMDRYLASL